MDQALSWDQLMEMRAEDIEPYIIPLGEVLSFLPLVTVNHKEKEAMRNGQSFLIMKHRDILPCEGLSLLRIQDQEGEFLGLGSVVGHQKNGCRSETHIKPSLVVTHV